MGESAARQFPPVELDEFERRLRQSVRSLGANHDALAELARIVGGQGEAIYPETAVKDPFEAIFAAEKNRPIAANESSDIGQHGQGWFERRASPPTAWQSFERRVQSGHKPGTEAKVQPQAEEPHSTAPDLEEKIQIVHGRPDEVPHSLEEFLAGSAAAHSDIASRHPPLPKEDPEFASFAWKLPSSSLRAPAPEDMDDSAMPDALKADAHETWRAEKPDLSRLIPESPITRPVSGSTKSEGRKRPSGMFIAAGVALAALVGGGIFYKNSTAPARGTPTILAAQTPVKVASPEPTTPTSAGQDPSVLGKTGKDADAPAKLVNREEQPVDIAQQVRTPRVISLAQNASEDGKVQSQPAPPSPVASLQPAPSQPLANSSPFPEPKRVKTISVRPDGTLIQPAIASSPIPVVQPTAPTPAPAAVPSQQIASVFPNASPYGQASGTTNSVPANSSAVASTVKPSSSTPSVKLPSAKIPTRAALPPKTSPDAQTDTPASDAIPVQLAGAKAKPATKSLKPVLAPPVVPETPDEADDAAPAKGAYSVQLAAPGSEPEARAVSARLQQKYAGSLGSYRPVIRKADLGDKSVFRIRVANLSQDQANSLCSKLKATGGSGACFVAKN